MVWYEVHYNKAVGQYWIYKVTGNGTSYVLFKVLKTEAAVKNFGKKHWLKWT